LDLKFFLKLEKPSNIFPQFINTWIIFPVTNEDILHIKEMRNDFEGDNLKIKKRIHASAITAKLSAANVYT